jgi:hypothetical protein
MQQIKEWISNAQDFEQGVSLYDKHGSDNAIKSLLKLGKNSFTEKKLLQAMEALSPSEPEPQQTKQTKQLPDKVRDWMKKREVYHNNLFHTPSLSDRKKLCFAILAIGRKLDKYFNDGIIEVEAAPAQPEDNIPTSAWDMHVLFGNNRSYITKNKKVAERVGEVKRRNTQNKLIEERLRTLEYGAV